MDDITAILKRVGRGAGGVGGEAVLDKWDKNRGESIEAVDH